MTEKAKKEPEEIKEPEVQVIEETVEATKAKQEKKKKVIQKKFAKYAKGK